MVQRVALIDGLTGDIHAQPLEHVVIHGGDDDRRVHVAAVERAELLHGAHGVFIRRGADGQRQQHFIGVQAGVEALHIAGFEGLNGPDDRRGDELDLVGNAREHLERIEQRSGGGTEESGGGGGTPYLEAASCFSCSSICLWFSITFSLSIGDKRDLFILVIN